MKKFTGGRELAGRMRVKPVVGRGLIFSAAVERGNV